MKNHGWPLDAPTHVRNNSTDGITGPLHRPLHGILVAALLLGSLGADAVAAGYASGSHPAASPPASSTHPGASAVSESSLYITKTPWMY